MLYYSYHVFCCTNQRKDNRKSCGTKDIQFLYDFLKRRVQDCGLMGPGKVRVNAAGCLGRCDKGPVLVIYPEGVWYTYTNEQDLEEILQEHLLQGRFVNRLRLS